VRPLVPTASRRARLSRLITATRILIRDPRIPKPLRWLGVVALLPVPGPIDELVLLALAPILMTFYRQPMREARRDAANSDSSSPTGATSATPARAATPYRVGT
jgi:hypothetical protein